MYTEEVVLGWAITFLCIGFFMLGRSSAYGEKDTETDSENQKNWGYLSLGATGVLLVIWLIVF